MILRVYALYNKSKIILISLVVILLAAIAVACVRVTHSFLLH